METRYVDRCGGDALGFGKSEHEVTESLSVFAVAPLSPLKAIASYRAP